MSGQKVPGVDDQPVGKLFRRKRGGIALTKEQIKEIKEGRKRIRKEMKEAGIYSKQAYNTTTSTMGLYFDKRGRFFLWFLRGKGLAILLGLAMLLLGTILAMSKISQMRGYFTINMQDELMDLGFVLSETEDFKRTSTQLFCEPAVDVPCISVTAIDKDVDTFEGQHNGYGYFAYTFFIRNEGKETVDYIWEMQIVGESKNLSVATWVMIFEDGKMCLYAERTADGLVQTVPSRDDNTRGYLEIPVMIHADPSQRFLEVVKAVGNAEYKRVITLPFVDEDIVAQGRQNAVAPQDTHKYTVVIWLEGDDPDCTNDLIEGHLGMDFRFSLVEE